MQIVSVGGRRYRVLDQKTRAKFMIGWCIVQAVGDALAGLLFGNGIPLLDERGEAVKDEKTGEPIMVGLDVLTRSRAARDSLMAAAAKALRTLDADQALDLAERVLLDHVEVDIAGGAADDKAPRGDGGWVVLGAPEHLDAHVAGPLEMVRLVAVVARTLAGGPTSAGGDTAGDSSDRTIENAET